MPTTKGARIKPRERFLPERDAADVLGVTRRALQKWRQRGGGPPYVRLTARCIRYPESDLIFWARDRTAHSTSEYPTSGGAISPST